MSKQFNEDGTYNKTDWKAGDKITATKLNKIEDAIEAVNDYDIARHEEADARLDALEASVVANKRNIDAKVDVLEDTVVSNKDAVDLDIYRIDQHMTLLDKKIDDGVAEVYSVAETMDGKITEADASMKAQIAEADAIVERGKADIETQVNQGIAHIQGLTNLDERLEEFAVNVKTFGAKGDSKTDDTDAIQAAFDYVSSTISAIDSGATVSFSTIYFPKGVYIISKPINIGNRVRIVGERSIIRSSADWCIDHTNGYHGGTIGWHTEISNMIFVGTNGVRLNTRQGDETAHANLDWGNIYFHNCIFQNQDGYAFVGDVQSCLLKFNMCLFNGPLDVLCDDFVMDTCWSNWRNYHSQEFVIFKGSKMYIDKCMFIPYAGNANVSDERAWVGLYDYTIPSGHQGMSFATIDKCNFGGEAAGISVVNNKTSYRSDMSHSCGVTILNSSLSFSSGYVVRLFEIPNQLVVRDCRGIEGPLHLIDLCKDFDVSKLDTAWYHALNYIYGGKFNWDCKNNSIYQIETTDNVRSRFGKELTPLYNAIQFKRNYMSGGKFRLISRHTNTCHLIDKFKYTDENGDFWIRIPGEILPCRHYNAAIGNNYRYSLRSFKMTIMTPNNRSGTFHLYSHNIWDYSVIITMATQPTNQSIRFIENSVFKSNYQDSTIGQITDACVGVNDINGGGTIRHPASCIPGDGFGSLSYIDLKLSGITSTDNMRIVLYDLMLDVFEEI